MQKVFVLQEMIERRQTILGATEFLLKI